MKNESTPKKKRVKHDLIYRLRKKGFRVATRQKTIFCVYGASPYDVIEGKRLRSEYNFYIQFEIG